MIPHGVFPFPVLLYQRLFFFFFFGFTVIVDRLFTSLLASYIQWSTMLDNMKINSSFVREESQLYLNILV